MKAVSLPTFLLWHLLCNIYLRTFRVPLHDDITLRSVFFFKVILKNPMTNCTTYGKNLKPIYIPLGANQRLNEID